MRDDEKLLLEGIKTSGFEEHWHDLLKDFKYKLINGRTSAVYIDDVGFWKVHIEAKNLFSSYQKGLLKSGGKSGRTYSWFSKITEIRFIASISWFEEEKVNYDIRYSYDVVGKEDYHASRIPSGYLLGDEIIPHFRKNESWWLFGEDE